MNQRLMEWLDQQISDKSLLTHPFYQDWKDGLLTVNDLRLYAGQYYHFEAGFPRFLSAVHSRCDDASVRQGILSNLWDEEHGDGNHQAMWLDFCAGLGLSREDVLATPAHPMTQALLDTYSGVCGNGSFQEGLAVIYAYESQVPEVAVEKLAGLRELYGITDESTLSFFDIHSSIDREHSRVEADAISKHTSTPEEDQAVQTALEAGLDAWWGFLDGVNELRAV
jgi:pyrroloquinoline-quinone synthase